jgi:hypothetical protein
LRLHHPVSQVVLFLPLLVFFFPILLSCPLPSFVHIQPDIFRCSPSLLPTVRFSRLPLYHTIPYCAGGPFHSPSCEPTVPSASILPPFSVFPPALARQPFDLHPTPYPQGSSRGLDCFDSTLIPATLSQRQQLDNASAAAPAYRSQIDESD